MTETPLLIMNLKSCFSIVLISVFAISAAAQNKSFIKSFDSSFSILPNQFLLTNNLPDNSQNLDPNSINPEELNASFVETLNTFRKKYKAPSLQYDTSLDKMAYILGYYLKPNKFKPTAKNSNRIGRYLYWFSRRIGVNQGLVTVVVDQPILLNYKAGQPYFYDTKDEETEYHFFYGDASMRKDPKAELEPITSLSYQEFCTKEILKLLKTKQGRKLRSKAYSKIACWIIPIEKTIGSRRLPKAKLIIVLSGKRLQKIS